MNYQTLELEAHPSQEIQIKRTNDANMRIIDHNLQSITDNNVMLRILLEPITSYYTVFDLYLRRKIVARNIATTMLKQHIIKLIIALHH